MRPVDAYRAIDMIDEWLDSVGTVLVGKGLSSYGELIGCIEDTPTLTPPMGYEVIEDEPNTRYTLNDVLEHIEPQNPLPAMISEIITGEELLRQTAEEAAELAQAALKVIRSAKGTTPLDGETAVDMLIEEIADVQNCIAVLAERLTALRDKADRISVEKMRRWRERLIAPGGTT